MKERLLELLTRLGYSATRLADEISVQRSGISHILSGRNQPSFEFLVKLLKRFPDIDAEWLLLGKGTMLKAQREKEAIQPKDSGNPKITKDLISNTQISTAQFNVNSSSHNNVINVTGINRVILLNSDGTFDVYLESGSN